jgi:hypothetical protein
MDILARSDSLTRTNRRSEDGDQGQEHEEEHGKEAAQKTLTEKRQAKRAKK